MNARLFFLLLASFIMIHPVFAADLATESSQGAPAESQDLQGAQSAQSEEPQAPAPSRKSKGRTPREKEAEGTQAPNRFGTDTIIKSKYELNGQPLEVDTE